ncbi:MAG: MarR family transcriptional regulator [Pseudomonadota bacterium]
MTETSDGQEKLPAAVEMFILRWGDMGGNWGVNRSISQIHAYLYMSERPKTAEDIAEDLEMARSNVSNSLKELQAWGLIRRVPVRNDRRDHFEAEASVWEIAARIAAGRKAREIDPAVAALKACMAEADGDPRVTAFERQRLQSMLDFTEALDRWYGQMLSVPPKKRDMLLHLGARVTSLLPGGRSKRTEKDDQD